MQCFLAFTQFYNGAITAVATVFIAFLAFTQFFLTIRIFNLTRGSYLIAAKTAIFAI